MTDRGYRPVTFAGEIVGVEWAGARARQAIEIALADLPDSDDRLPDVVLRVGAHADRPTLTLVEGSRCRYRGTSVGACAHALLQTTLNGLIGRSGSGLVVHAALVGRGGAGVLLPGATGSGKTMLCAWLSRRGLTYYSDEACYVAAGTVRAGGFARPLCFRGSWAEPLGARAAEAHSEPGGDGVSLVRARSLPAACGRDAVVPRLMVCPAFQPGAALAMTRLSPARAAARLLPTIANWRNLPDHGVGQVTEFVRSVPAYDLTYGAFDQLDALWALTESATR